MFKNQFFRQYFLGQRPPQACNLRLNHLPSALKRAWVVTSVLGSLACGLGACGSSETHPLREGAEQEVKEQVSYDASAKTSASACSVSSSTADAEAASAQILIIDGGMRHLCGCWGVGESPGTYVFPPQPLTCELASPESLVFFQVAGTLIRHQILLSDPAVGSTSSTSDPWTQATRVTDPELGMAQGALVLSFPQGPGVYSFKDAFSASHGSFKLPAP